ncbi:hypothetical protein [Streptomyces sp. RKAG337]|uniref:hypothetical protein n=1 Tax=Streptomyces sp. RKAG337 TaxID=2893404 RepID=UPI002033A135|nr:hypothetical protein [Streptomyces sp. RKAG337]MCM2424873.1 hypothetical protein [Streptomyces sp. RKAG337]
MTALGTEPAPLTASGLEAALAALPPVYAAAARMRTLPLAAGAFTVAGPCREPVLLLRLRVPLADRAVVVRPPPDRTGEVAWTVVFAPFSGAGTLLPGCLPPSGANGAGAAGDLTVTVDVHVVAAPECHTDIPAGTALGPALGEDDAAALVEGVLLEGLLARLAYLSTMEKQRMIRQAREIAACRHVDLAFGGALDALGRDLAVPRRPSEDDAFYRSRLAMFTSWRLPTRGGLTDALNGPGADTAPNKGLPSLVGVTARFRLVEEQNTLSLSTCLVDSGTGGPALRDRFHRVLRARYLLDLDGPVPLGLPSGRFEELRRILDVLSAELTRPAGARRPRYLAPTLAADLSRLVQLVRALGDSGPLTLHRAHVEEPDPLHELGLGVTLDRFGKSRLDALAAAVPGLASGTGELAALARSLEPRMSDADPLGRWLIEPCGLRTVHPLDATTVYLSALPTAGLAVEAPPSVTVGSPVTFQARYVASGTAGGLHVLAAEAVELTGRRFEERHLGTVQALVADGVYAVLQTVAGRTGSNPPSLLAPLIEGKLLADDSAAFAGAVLEVADLDQVVAYPFAPADIGGPGGGTALRDAVAARMTAMTDSGFYAVRGIWDDAGRRLVVLAAVCALPDVPAEPGNPRPRSSAGTRRRCRHRSHLPHRTIRRGFLRSR